MAWANEDPSSFAVKTYLQSANVLPVFCRVDAIRTVHVQGEITSGNKHSCLEIDLSEKAIGKSAQLAPSAGCVLIVVPLLLLR